METLSSLMMLGATVLFIFLLIRILAAPIKKLFKLALNAGLGFIGLFIFNFFGEFVGLSIPITLVSVLVTGCFGVPGLLLLVLAQFIF